MLSKVSFLNIFMYLIVHKAHALSESCMWKITRGPWSKDSLGTEKPRI